jgi:DNA-binding Lrp family transcriptional regulator
LDKHSLQAQGYDQLDVTILEELQVNCRISVSDLARKIHLSQPAVHNRIKRLERDGVIRRYVAMLDREMVGYSLLCFIRLTLHPHNRDVFCEAQDKLSALPAVQEMYRTAGAYDLLLKVVLPDHQALDTFISEELRTIRGVERVDAEVVLNEVKHTTAIKVK